MLPNEYAISLGYEDCEPAGNWNGMRTWWPVWGGDEVCHVGLPLFIIEQGDGYRMSTPQEAKDRLFSD